MNRRHAVRAGLLLALVLSVLTALTPGSAGALLVRITNSTDTTAAAPFFTCAGSAAAGTPSAFLIYPLQDALGNNNAADVSGNGRTGTYYGSPVHSNSTACSRDTGGSTTFNGTNTYVVSPGSALLNLPYTMDNTASVEIWFRTTVAGGYLIGFDNAATGPGTSSDRHLYLTTEGKIAFGVNPGTNRTITSPLAYNNGAWHHAAATLGTNGILLYVDGSLVASSAATTTASGAAGYWRMGYGTLAGWPGTASNYYFTGQLSYAYVNAGTLSAAKIAEHYAAGS